MRGGKWHPSSGSKQIKRLRLLLSMARTPSSTASTKPRHLCSAPPSAAATATHDRTIIKFVVTVRRRNSSIFRPSVAHQNSECGPRHMLGCMCLYGQIGAHAHSKVVLKLAALLIERSWLAACCTATAFNPVLHESHSAPTQTPRLLRSLTASLPLATGNMFPWPNSMASKILPLGMRVLLHSSEASKPNRISLALCPLSEPNLKTAACKPSGPNCNVTDFFF